MGSSFFSSTGYYDELTWAAAWLNKATGEMGYLETARALFNKGSLCDEDDEVPNEFDWDSKTVGVYVLMYELTKEDRSDPAALSIWFMWDRLLGRMYELRDSVNHP